MQHGTAVVRGDIWIGEGRDDIAAGGDDHLPLGRQDGTHRGEHDPGIDHGIVRPPEGAFQAAEMQEDMPSRCVLPSGGNDRRDDHASPTQHRFAREPFTYPEEVLGDVQQRFAGHLRNVGPVPGERVVNGHLQPCARGQFGSCSGGLVGLELAVRHPAVVRSVLAHEPPALCLLPDAAQYRGLTDAVHEAFQKEGAPSAMRRLSVLFGGREAPHLPEAHDNTAFFLAHMLRPSTRFMPDLTALAAMAERIGVAEGRDSHAQIVHQPVVVVAELLGEQLAEFPAAMSATRNGRPPRRRVRRHAGEEPRHGKELRIAYLDSRVVDECLVRTLAQER
ncbi:hypothetical protein [Streptomyces sp. A5-4]|uniref:hypothetical protein n=1 Tax=Streptomyces sp. A5-4 TaxID=3384771 RepID=UPI003DA7B955